jgi:hypothetical protein
MLLQQRNSLRRASLRIQLINLRQASLRMWRIPQTNTPVSSQPCQRNRDDQHKSSFSSRFAAIQALHDNYVREVQNWTIPPATSYRPICTLLEQLIKDINNIGPYDDGP